MIDPVMADLARYERQLEREESRAEVLEAIEAKLRADPESAGASDAWIRDEALRLLLESERDAAEVAYDDDREIDE